MEKTEKLCRLVLYYLRKRTNEFGILRFSYSISVTLDNDLLELSKKENRDIPILKSQTKESVFCDRFISLIIKIS